MKLENIEQIVDNLCVFMPSGIEAELSLDEEGNVIVKYYDDHHDTYTQDEFGNLINDGIEILNPVTIPQQSVLMENEILDKEFNELNDVEELIDFIDKHPEYKLWQDDIDESQLQDINRLDRIQKTASDIKVKQSAITLMNAVGMGVKLDKEIDNLEKKNKVDEAQYTDDEYHDDIMQGKAGYNPEFAVVTEGKWQVFPITDSEPQSYYATTWIGEGENAQPLDVSRFYNNDITNWTILLDGNVVKRFQWGTQLSVIADWVNTTYNLEDPLTVYILNVIVDMDKEGRLVDESLNEISDELANKVQSKRVQNFVNAKLHDKNPREEARKLNKNSKLMTKRNKENEMSDISKLTEELNTLMNETSDEVVQSTYEKRSNNFADAHKKAEDTFNKVAEKAASKEGNIDDVKKEWKDSQDDLDNAEKKYRNNVELAIKRAIRKAKQPKEKNEEFTDEMSMLTDIQDLDFPDALADTVETTDEGEVLTLGKVADEIKDMKDEIVAELQDVKTEIKTELETQAVEADADAIDDEIEFEDDIEELEDKVDELEDNVEDQQDDVIEDAAEEVKDEIVDEIEDNIEEEPEEDKNDDEEEMEESFKKYLRTGKLEDLQQQKMNIDKSVRNGDNVETIKNDIVLNSENEKEEKEAKEYAAAKLKESLLGSKSTSILSEIVTK